MTRRPFGPGWRLSQDEPLDKDDGGIDEINDPDPTVNFPQWSRSLLLLLDYAIIEGLRHKQYRFVDYLKLAEAELTKVAANGNAEDGSESDEDRPPPSKAH